MIGKFRRGLDRTKVETWPDRAGTDAPLDIAGPAPFHLPEFSIR